MLRPWNHAEVLRYQSPTWLAVSKERHPRDPLNDVVHWGGPAPSPLRNSPVTCSSCDKLLAQVTAAERGWTAIQNNYSIRSYDSMSGEADAGETFVLLRGGNDPRRTAIWSLELSNEDTFSSLQVSVLNACDVEVEDKVRASDTFWHFWCRCGASASDRKFRKLRNSKTVFNTQISAIALMASVVYIFPQWKPDVNLLVL